MYRHTQRGDLILVLVGGSWLLVAGLSLVAGPHPVALAVLAVLTATLVIFASLTVEVDRGRLSIGFGSGFWRKSWPLEELRSWRTVRNPWWYGWGVRLTPSGWLYNVSGFSAVEIELGDGRRARIGTDDPDGLVAALERATAGRSTRTVHGRRRRSRVRYLSARGAFCR